MMKERRLFILLLILVVLTTLNLFNVRVEFGADPVEAQVFGANFLWQDSLITTTAAQDSYFTNRWEQIAIRTDTIPIWYRVGTTGDTASWSSRDWVKLDEGASISYGPATPLRRFEWKADAGTGVIFFEGYKKVKQN